MAYQLSCVEEQGEEKESGIIVKAISLLYHDIVKNGQFDSSGFSGKPAAAYKLEVEEFKRHAESISSKINRSPVNVHDLIGREISNLPFLLTFDDGGASAHRYIADILEGFGWYGHFFVTVDYIGNRNFLTEEQIIDLKRRGHVIGTHSCSHPTRMASCSWEDILKEWSQSTRSLSEILGEKVRVASVPGGYYTKIVAEAASKAGIEALFTSEPTMRCHRVDECLVLGRYTVRRGTPPGVAGSLAAGDFEPRIKQWLLWNARKLPKSIGGELYLKMRHFILRNWE